MGTGQENRIHYLDESMVVAAPAIVEAIEQHFSSLPEAVTRRFKLVRLLGSGSGGTVYLCYDREKPGPARALKVLARDEANADVNLDRFYDEGKAALRIKSNHVVKCFDILMADEFFAYTMEYIEGTTIAHILESPTRPSMLEVEKILMQIAQGLSDIHTYGIVHRDIKPTNLLISSAGQVYITDLGVARIPSREMIVEHAQIICAPEALPEQLRSTCKKKERLTSAGGIIGTLDYLSPEYVERGILDFRCDVYAFGIIAFQLLTGRLPFLASHAYARLLQRVTKSAPTVRSLNRECSHALSALISLTLARDPSIRPESGRALVQELSKIIKRA